MRNITNRLIFLSVFIAMLMLFPVSAQSVPGWDRNITVEWGYDPPTDLVLSGFKLYRDGEAVCEWSVPTIRTGACSLILTKKSTSFTLTALFNDGQESQHSDPYVLIDWGPKPRIIIVKPK